MQKTKILAVAPYEGMADILTDIAQSRDDIALTVQTGDLFTGRDIAMQLAHKNYQKFFEYAKSKTDFLCNLPKKQLFPFSTAQRSVLLLQFLPGCAIL